MEDTERINIYLRGSGYLDIKITNGAIELISEVWGDYDSEAFYLVKKEEADKIFAKMNLDEFVELMKTNYSVGAAIRMLEKMGVKVS